MIILDLFIDIVQLQVEFVDHRAIRKVAPPFRRLAARNIDSVEDLVHGVAPVYFQ